MLIKLIGLINIFMSMPHATAEGKVFNAGKFMGNNFEVQLKLEQNLMSVTEEVFRSEGNF